MPIENRICTEEDSFRRISRRCFLRNLRKKKFEIESNYFYLIHLFLNIRSKGKEGIYFFFSFPFLLSRRLLGAGGRRGYRNEYEKYG